MTAPNRPPVLTDPGYGRTWAVEQIKPTMFNRRKRWSAALISREETMVGYIAQYDDGWGANTIVRGKQKMVRGVYRTPQAAAEALLKARRSS